MAQGMNKLNEALVSLPEVRELLLSLDAGTSPIAVSGLSGVHRAQLAAAGHPLLGDGKYAVNRGDRRLGYVHQALCAYTLAFDFAAPHELLGYLKGREFHAARPHFLELF